MSELLSRPVGVPSTATRPPTVARWEAARWVLLLAWAGYLVAVLLVGERTASWSDLTSQVQAGHVHDVVVSDELPAGAEGGTTVTVRWKNGPFHYRSSVDQVRGADPDGEPGSGSHVLRVAPSTVLAGLDPQLVIHRGETRFYSDEVAGFDLPDGFVATYIVLWLTGLAVIAFGPESRRATRVAWMWLSFLPFGVLAFGLLGRARSDGPGARPRRRLTGGWAFLLMLVAVGLVNG